VKSEPREPLRLNRYLASCGLGSRRSVESLIRSGEVRINGKVVRELSTTVNTDHDKVTVGIKDVRPPMGRVYILMHKPRGYDVTRGGRHHHRRAWDLLPAGTHQSVQSVGRLDRNSTGLLLFTNDGETANRLTHPRFGCRKFYDVLVSGKVNEATLRKFREGIELDDGPARVVEIERLRINPERMGDQTGRTGLRMVITEGRNRIIRRMCDAVEHPVVALHRTRMGPLELGKLPTGRTRPLKQHEVNTLKKYADDLAGRARKPEP
jgi:23S rRNA pseudouridine2605 synthase